MTTVHYRWIDVVNSVNLLVYVKHVWEDDFQGQ